MAAASLPTRPDIQILADEPLRPRPGQKVGLSILIPTKDRFILIKPCLQSLLKTVSRPEVEILIGDTGSSDPDVFETYRAFASAFAGAVRLIRFSGYHFSSNNNALAARASGENLVFLNNDTIALDGWEKPLLKHLQTPEVGAAGSKLLFHNDRIQHAGIEFIRSGAYRFLGYHPHRNRHSLMPEANFETYAPAVTGACLAIRKETLESVGGFDPEYAEEAQDTDLCLKLRERGLKSVYTPKSVLHHFENGTRSISEDSADRRLFVSRWKSLIEREFLSETFQSIPIDRIRAKSREIAKRVLFVREQARGDVLASTAIVRAYKERNPSTHITFKTAYPELVDAISFIDRALHTSDYDDLTGYDEVIRPTYENGEWRDHSHSWLQEMARTSGLDPGSLHNLRPELSRTAMDPDQEAFFSALARKRKYVAFATGAGWREREWTGPAWDELAKRTAELGFDVVQIGGSQDHWVRGAFHLLDRPLHENLAILDSASALVTLDSFPLHLGITLGLPSVVLTCKTSSHTVWLPPEAKEIRHHAALSTPLPECRTTGCRLRYGNGTENSCPNPILKELPVTPVFEALKSALIGRGALSP